MNVDEALQWATAHFSGIIEGNTCYGWHQKSAGARLVLHNTHKVLWLRVQYRNEALRLNDRLWQGELEASTLNITHKPLLVDHLDWQKTETAWRATLSSIITEKVCHSRPDIQTAPVLSPKWFETLQQNLADLSQQAHKDRVNCRQDLINRRIKERFGEHIDTGIKTWVTCHGDLHWANLTQDSPYLLDWEGWGQGPRGLDAALLLGYSAACPAIVEQIHTTFSDDLKSNDGKLAILYVCSELIRMNELYGDYTALQSPLKTLAEQTLKAL